MSDRADGIAAPPWPVIVHDACTTAGRAGVAHLDGDALIVELAGGARLAFPLAGIAILSLPAGPARGLLAPAAAGAARIAFDAPALAHALAASGAHRRGRRAAAARAAWRAALHVVPALAVAALLTVVALPLLADRIAARVPAESERAFGAALAGRLGSALARSPAEADICRATQGRAALEALFARLVAAAGPLPHPPVLQVVGASAANAYALPGGRVLLFSGMIEFAASPDELAGVLAHEIAHVAHRDPVRAVIRSAALGAAIGTLTGDPLLGASLAALAVRLLGLSHARAAEMRADAGALAILAEAGVPARGFADLFARLAARDAAGHKAAGAYLSSHPPLDARAARAASAAGAAAGAGALDAAQWASLRRDCGAAR